MKRVLILSMCVLLCGASSASASTLAGVLSDAYGDYVTVNYTVTPILVLTNHHVDEVDFTISAMQGTGADWVTGISGGGIYGNSGGGVFSTVGGGYIALSTSTSLWAPDAATNIGVNPTGFPVPGSWVNLDSYTTGANRTGSGSNIAGVTSTGLTGIKGYTSFQGAWSSFPNDNPQYEYDDDDDQVYNDDNTPVILGYAPQFPKVGDILATIYVTTGTKVQYNGLIGLDNGNAVGGTFENVPYVGPLPPPVPEPSTLALLVSGMIGLLAYAWKKRK